MQCYFYSCLEQNLSIGMHEVKSPSSKPGSRACSLSIAKMHLAILLFDFLFLVFAIQTSILNHTERKKQSLLLGHSFFCRSFFFPLILSNPFATDVLALRHFLSLDSLFSCKIKTRTTSIKLTRILRDLRVGATSRMQPPSTSSP